ncbi:phage holin family protein [Methylomonas koyamae]|uniref:phage holin family protein n=1 Tax=Methylomonas koyamae TaxID=702114 RepID=UPI0021B43C73|nr:phage holin family protein [Methylomonas koyamae]
MLADIQALWDQLYGLGQDRFRLAALETRRAGQSLVTIIVAGIMLALLLSAAWLALLAAGVHWLAEYGLAVGTAILIAVAINLLSALVLCSLIRRQSRYLQFPALQRSLKTPLKPPSNRRRG